MRCLFISSAVIILLVFHNHYFRPLRIQVKTLIPASAAFAIVLTKAHEVQKAHQRKDATRKAAP